MASIFKEIHITWQGVEHRITPTMRLINQIEQEVSLSRLAARLHAGDVPISHLSCLIAAFLRSDGVKVSDEEVYASLINGEEQEAINAAAASIFESVFPATPKKSDAAQKQLTK